MSEETTASDKPQRRIVGRVVSDKMNKTITVLVERRVRHPLYGKYVKKSTRLHVHDENNESHEGDMVAVVETRPLSRSKRFRLVEILERATGVEAAS
jgi:small subunit ribosomal protein S17